MLYSKACPRCTGDVKLDRDNFGVYAKCLQCGFNRDFKTRRDVAEYSAGISPVADPGLAVTEPVEEEQRRSA